MMLGNNSSTLVPANSSAGNTHDGGGSGSGSGSIPGGGGGGGFSDEDKARMEVGDSGGGGGNRWPRQETLELLRIRSEMEVTFRDSNLKSPLWEEVSRKMAELGYRRSAKKCKEKFENVYKYHKRTKDGRASKSDGKTYRFFEQLEALEKNAPSFPSPQSQHQPRRLLQIQSPMPISQAPIPLSAATAIAPQQPLTIAVAAAPLVSNVTTNVTSIPTHVTVSSAPAAIPVSFSPNLNNNPLFSTLPFSSQHMSAPADSAAIMNNPPPPPPQGNTTTFQSSHHTNVFSSLPSDEFTSSSTSSDEDIRRRHKRKRKLKDFFEGMLQNMMEKQEQLHKNFLEALEKRERDRMIREEAWRVQEMARMNRELDLLNQERSMAAAKDAAVTAFLQKFGTNNAPQIQLSLPKQNSHPPLPQPQPQPMEITTPKTAAPPQAVPPPQPPAPAEAYGLALALRHEANNNGGENFMTPSPSRWPKTEVEALIKLRSNMDMKYQDNLPKGPLWEEISAQMSKLGYNRSSKRCKEKWENINKYFKKVKESSKIRPEDSKTCPYFHLLDALYKEKAIADANANANSYHISYPNPIKPDQPPLAIMARPEQQWPVPIQESAMDEDDELDSENYDDDEEDEEEEGSHEMETNKQQAAPPPTTTVSVTTTTATAV